MRDPGFKSLLPQQSNYSITKAKAMISQIIACEWVSEWETEKYPMGFVFAVEGEGEEEGEGQRLRFRIRGTQSQVLYSALENLRLPR